MSSSCDRAHPGFQLGGHYDGSFINLVKKTVPKSWRYVEEDSLVAHHFKLLISHGVAMLDGVCTSIDGRLDRDLGLSVNRNFLVRAVGFLDDGRQRRH